MGQHVVLKLALGGGPEPKDELRRVYCAAQNDVEGRSWIATRKPGARFTVAPDSRLLAFAQLTKAEVLVLTAYVDDRCAEMPDHPLARDMYGDYENHFQAYWRIRDVELNVMARTDLPGKTLQGKSLSEAFIGHLSFAYWRPGVQLERPALRMRTSEERAPAPVRLRGIEAVPLHGVDFSGATETNGRNRKLWVASWYPDRGAVSLECGDDGHGFGRIDLAERIVDEGGMWVIDFPFGPPAAIADAAGWRTWHDYLAWCASKSDPTELRDELRVILERQRVPWSTKREIDAETDATWFPFFEQLYRQTITGARDLLARLNGAGRERTSVWPFHGECVPTPQRSVVVEGFPGWTLRQMGLPSTGYKHSTDLARDRRATILDALCADGLLIGDAERRRVLEDSEGDAIDAFVLLRAAWCAQGRAPRDWSLPRGGSPKIEGWYFD